MAAELAQFLTDGGASLLASFVLFLVVAATLGALSIAGLAMHLREPRGDEPSRNMGPVVQIITLALVCLPVAVAIGGALAARAETLETVPMAAAEMRAMLLSSGLASVINNSVFVAFLLVVLPPLAAAALAIWGPLRTRAIDLWHAHRLEREVSVGEEP